MRDRPYSGGNAVADALLAHGVSHAFCVPGESYLPILDALHDARDKIKLVTCRHESGAAFMAEATAKLTGKPGVCLVSRGPGAANAAIGVHTAKQDSTPLVLLIGQVSRRDLGREAFQEVEFREMFKPLAKSVTQVERPEDIAGAMVDAFYTAQSGRPGPAVVVFPEDVLSSRVEQKAAKQGTIVPLEPERAKPTEDDIAKLKEMLTRAGRPLVILGGAGWTKEAAENFRTFAGREGLPVACAFRHQDLFDARSGNYVGDAGIGINPKLAGMIERADVIFTLGARLAEMTTQGYTIIRAPEPKQALIHVHPGKEELGRVFKAALAIHSTPANLVAGVKDVKLGRAKAWAGWLKEGRKNYLDWSAPCPNPGKVQVGGIYAFLNEALPDDAILANGAGNFAAWLHRHYRYRGFRTQLGPTSGAMGYGVPAAIGAKIVTPERTVVCCAGDGDFLMTGNELATAVMYGAAVIFLVFNNTMYGTIRMHQEQDYPGRVSGTDLVNPDFAKFAESFGVKGSRAATNAEFEAAFRAALASKSAALIEIAVDRDAISPSKTITGLRKGKT